jgi:hypothetical protein
MAISVGMKTPMVDVRTKYLLPAVGTCTVRAHVDLPDHDAEQTFPEFRRRA